MSTAWDAATFLAGIVQAQSSSAAMLCSPFMCVQQAAACVAYLSVNRGPVSRMQCRRHVVRGHVQMTHASCFPHHVTPSD